MENHFLWHHKYIFLTVFKISLNLSLGLNHNSYYLRFCWIWKRVVLVKTYYGVFDGYVPRFFFTPPLAKILNHNSFFSCVKSTHWSRKTNQHILILFIRFSGKTVLIFWCTLNLKPKCLFLSHFKLTTTELKYQKEKLIYF